MVVVASDIHRKLAICNFSTVGAANTTTVNNPYFSMYRKPESGHSCPPSGLKQESTDDAALSIRAIPPQEIISQLSRCGNIRLLKLHC